MKKAVIGILLMLLLTGCWDRLPLRNQNLVDIAGLDVDEKSGDVVLDYVVTKLTGTGQGEGEPHSKTTELRGPSLVEAVGQGAFIEQGPFLAINTGIYLMSEKFASHYPFRELAFLLKAPYTSINTPVIVLEGSVSKFLKSKSGTNKPFAKNLKNFVLLLNTNGIIPNVSMMQLILSHVEPLEDLAIPVLKQSDSEMELDGALLFRQGKNSGAKLSREQIGMWMFLSGKAKGWQKFTGHLPIKDDSGNDIDYGFFVRKGDSKIIIHPESSGLPKVNIEVKLKINVFEIGEEVHILKSDYVNRMEAELSSHLQKKAVDTIKSLQKANCDILGIGKQIKAFHPDTWKSLDWRQDFPRMSIEPKFDVQILNADTK